MQPSCHPAIDCPALNSSPGRCCGAPEFGQIVQSRHAASRIHHLFEQQVHRKPGAIAVVFGDQTLTYAELNARANRLAHDLRSRGVRAEVPVGICIERSLEMLIGILGVSKAGGAYVPLDPAYPEQRQSFILRDAGIQLLLTSRKTPLLIHSDSPQCIFVDSNQDIISQESETNPDYEGSPQDLACVIYTSGSTGMPKGVMLTHAAISHFVQTVQGPLELTEEDVYLQTASITFVVSIRQLMTPLSCGATLVVADTGQIKDPELLFDLIKRRGITTMDVVPSYWRSCIRVLSALAPNARARLLDNRVRQIVSGGEPLSSDVPADWKQGFKHRARILNVLGQTETSGLVTIFQVPEEFDALPQQVPIGRPIGYTHIHILDSDLQPAAAGDIGEMHIASPALARGYLNQPDLTGETFIPDPFSTDPRSRLYKTGDLARLLPDGNIEFAGRTDHRVKIRGFRVELGEIEMALRRHPAIREAVVGANEIDRDEKQLTAYLVLAPQAEVSTTDLRNFLKKILPDYMLPLSYFFLDSFPLTSSGKIDRLALKPPGQEISGNEASSGPIDSQTMEDWFYLPSWERTEMPRESLHGGPEVARSRWMIFADSRGVGAEIAECLRRRGQSVVIVHAGAQYARLNENEFTLDPDRREHYDALLRDLSEETKQPNGIIHLWAVSSSENQQSQIQSLGFYSLLFLSQAIGQQNYCQPCQLVVVSDGMQEVTGKEDLCPEKATLLGPCRVLPLEYPNLICRSIDIVMPEPESSEHTVLAERILAEATTNPPERIAAYRGSYRWVQTLRPLHLARPAAKPGKLRENGVYLITGGLGGIGLELARYLAQTVRAKLALIGRSTFPPRWAWDSKLGSDEGNLAVRRKIEKIRELETLGSEVMVLSADVTNREQIEAAVAEVCRRFGTIHGVIHAAGVRGTFHETQYKTPEIVETIFAPKLKGTKILADVLQDIKLDFMIFCSSLASILGRYGQIDYCAANSFLNAFALHISRKGTNTASINWDVWQELGTKIRAHVSANHDALLEADLKNGILSHEGREAFGRILDCASSQVIVSKRELGAHSPGHSLKSPQHQTVDPTTDDSRTIKSGRPNLALPYAAPRSPVEEVVSSVWAKLLGLERVGVNDDFFDLGGHSLLATQVISRLKAVFHIELPLRNLFESPTVAGLAKIIDSSLHAGQKDQGPAIERIPQKGPIPLSFSQERLWFLDRMEPGSAYYNIPAALHLKGDLQIAPLERALNSIVRRHEVLRTTIRMSQGDAVQQIAPELMLALPMIDLSSLPDVERDARMKHLALEEAQKPFDLTHGPLLRTTLVRLGDREYVLLLILHHIIADGWSISVFLKELAALYGAFLSGNADPLSPLRVQYADFACWQRGRLQGEVLENQISYWKQQLAGAPPVLDLPTDRLRPAIQTFCGAYYSFVLPKKLLKSLHALSRQEQATLFMTLLSAFQALLHRYTAQEDIVIGSPIANRNRAEIEDLIGFFVNMLVLRTDFSGDPTFKQLLARVREVTLGAYAHQDLPFEKLVEILQPQRDLSRSPLFQVMFILQNAPPPPAQLGSLDLNLLHLDSGTSKYDLTLYLTEMEQGLRATLEYNTDLFEASTIARFAGHFQTLLEGIVANPGQTIAKIPLLPEAEKSQILVEWNATAEEYPEDIPLSRLFELQVERTPDSVAVVCEGTVFSYRELNRRANQLAHHLQRLGVGPEVRVGICVDRSAEMVVGLLGILKAGGVYVPLDPTYPAERLDFMIGDAGLTVLLTQERLARHLPKCTVKRCLLDSEWGSIAKGAEANPASKVTKENLNYIIYTSGSTGKPKGVQIRSGALVNFLHSMCREPGMTHEDTILAVTTISFDIAALELFLPLIVGARIVIASREVAADGVRLMQLLKGEGVTVMQATPATWRLLIEAGWRGQAHLRMLCGGEAMPWSLAEQLLDRGESLWNMYGPTETTIWSAVHKVERGDGSAVIGHPIANTQLYILNAGMQPAPIGVPGELYIGGDGLARGYLNRPELTEEQFVPDPFCPEPGARLYKTGDLVSRLGNGGIQFWGRLDHQVKLRGFRIELGEIENALHAVPGVQGNAVILREDEPGDQRLVAYYVSDRKMAPGIELMREALRSQLPSYMVPAEFIPLDALPLTPNGKVDRRALPAPERRGSAADRVVVGARDELERLLVGVWESLLGIKPISVEDNFFDLGGHSLLALRVFAQMEKLTGSPYPLSLLFQAPTIAQLAALMRTQDATNCSSLLAFHDQGSKPILFSAHFGGKELAQYLETDQPWYGFHMRSWEGKRSPEDVGDIAADYIQRMKSVQPTGPYFLSGYSFGGIVAFEMAQQLIAQGQKIALLMLIVPSNWHHIRFGTRGAKERLKSICRKFIYGVSELYLSKGKPIPVSLRARYGTEVSLRALRRYTPKLYPGRIVLLTTHDERQHLEASWRKLALKGIDLFELPGDHFDIFNERHRKQWLQQIVSCLRDAQTPIIEEDFAHGDIGAYHPSLTSVEKRSIVSAC
jgi:amino acid adenylation domain-containing protein